MKKRMTALLLAVAALLTLTACGQKSPVHEHVWQEAGCLTPKTCTDCGETEGEPLGHSATEATHWAPSVCSACGEQLGEALVPDFEKYGYKVIDASEVPTEHSLTVNEAGEIVSTGVQYTTGLLRSANGYRESYRSDVVLKEREIFEGDEEHPAADGYEWRYYEFEIMLSEWLTPDGRICTGGYQIGFSDDDYYDIAARDDSARGLHYTVTWQGEEYADCMRIVTFSEKWESGTTPLEGYGSVPVSNLSCYVWVRVPTGYDGAMFAFRDARDKLSPGMHIYDLPKSATDKMTFIRLN